METVLVGKFKSVQCGIWELRKVCKMVCSTLSFRGLPDVAFDTVSVLVRVMTALQYGKRLASTTLLMHADAFSHCSPMADLCQVALHLLKNGRNSSLDVSAISTFSPVSLLSSNVCVCMDGMNLKYALRWHIHISVHSMLCQYIHTSTHTHMHPQTI